jgi:hypothetical protein
MMRNTEKNILPTAFFHRFVCTILLSVLSFVFKVLLFTSFQFFFQLNLFLLSFASSPQYIALFLWFNQQEYSLVWILQVQAPPTFFLADTFINLTPTT